MDGREEKSRCNIVRFNGDEAKRCTRTIANFDMLCLDFGEFVSRMGKKRSGRFHTWLQSFCQCLGERLRGKILTSLNGPGARYAAV